MSKKGCGCIVGGIAVVAMITLAAFAAFGWYFYSTFTALDQDPKPLAVPDISEEAEAKIKLVDEKLRTIFEQGEGGSVNIPSDLINPWLRLNSNADLRFLGEHTWLSLAGERVTAQIAAPLAPIGLQGRYFNGEVIVSGWLRKGKTRLFLHDATIDGAAGDKIAWLTRLVEGRDLAAPLDLDSLLNVELRHRCAIEVRSSQVELDCTPRVER